MMMMMTTTTTTTMMMMMMMMMMIMGMTVELKDTPSIGFKKHYTTYLSFIEVKNNQHIPELYTLSGTNNSPKGLRLTDRIPW